MGRWDGYDNFASPEQFADADTFLFRNVSDSTQNANGSIIETTYLLLKANLSRSPEAYGAVGDGSTDDTTNWNLMVAAINTAAFGILNLLPGKTYMLGNVTTFDQLDGFVINFNGAKIKTAANTGVGTGDTGYMLRFTNCDNITINDPIIDGNRDNLDYTATGDGQAHGIFIQYSRNVKIDKPHIYDCGTDGIYIGATTGTTTQRSENVTIEGGEVYRSRRNNVTIAGALNVTNHLKENTYAGATVGSSAGTAPKAGVDLEPNATGTTNQNENIILEGTKYSDNVTTDIVVGGEADGVFIKKNTFATDTAANSINLAHNVNNAFIQTNYFASGNYQIGTHSSRTFDGLEISGNQFKGATTGNIYIEATAMDNCKIFNNTIVTNVLALYFNPSSATNTQSNVIAHNTYILNDDESAANTAIMTLRNCNWHGDRIIRESGVSNNYRISIFSGTMEASDIETINSNVSIYDAGFLTDIDNIISLASRVLKWRDTAAPSSGAWYQGATAWNTAPAAGGAPGWICTTAGTSGTWKAMANLAA